MVNKSALFLCLLLQFATVTWATKIFIPMSADGQVNHLKAYGIAFGELRQGRKVDWLLNYKGGSFGMEFTKDLAKNCADKDVTYQKISDKEYADLLKEVQGLKYDGAVIKLEKAPRIAVYTPLNKEPWDDAVTLALTYAEIPFDKVYATEALNGKLDNYDWLHLHHEDFTGQYGKFWAQFRSAQWYIQDQNNAEALASKNGFKKVSQMQMAVVKRIQAFVQRGGNLFAMCSATDTYDIALAADGTDICETQFDGDPMDENAQNKLNFKKCVAFRNFTVSTNPYEYEYSNIDNTNFRKIAQPDDKFALNTFPVKPDPVPAMLCQNHTNVINGFMGQTTAFRKEVLKPDVLILGENKELKEARYIHGDYGRGTWTFYGGHDPEDYQHSVGDPPTSLAFHSSSPGYRLILNNVLSPAAKRKDVPTVNCCDSPGNATPNAIATSKIAGNIELRPDPATNEIVVIVPQKSENSRLIIVTDATGKEVIHKLMPSNNIRISLLDFPAGIYMVQVDGIYAGKVRKD